MSVWSAYLHIPFCRRRCYYCDFPVKVMGDRTDGSNSSAIAHYLQRLCQEIRLAPVGGHALQTVFLGGGTPSLLTPEQVATVLGTLDQHFGIASKAEISLEIDPGTFDQAQLQGYVDVGVNRISLGVQAFQDQLLQKLGRTHTRQDIQEAVASIHRVGILNYSFDLISGLPHQTLEDWQESLKCAIALHPAHLSCYDLILEPGTAFERQVELGRLDLPPDRLSAEMYRLAQQYLTQAGYKHYEISNYARPGYECRHNCVYWKHQNFYGFGMGAASFLQGYRFTRPRTTTAYQAWVEHEAHQFYAEPPILDWDLKDQLSEVLMLGLRLADGIEWQTLCDRFGETCLDPLWDSICKFQHQGWMHVQDNAGQALQLCAPQELPLNGRICLSDPEGFLFSNTILSTFFSALENKAIVRSKP